MKLKNLSEKQKQVLSFVLDDRHYIIADGSVRSGKTTIMILGFVIWAMQTFNGCNFAICGKTVSSVERNVIKPFQGIDDLPYKTEYRLSKHILIVTCGSKVNYFYVFGAGDEKSQDLIQGITLSGIFMDEVALMKESFVKQALTRILSVPEYKVWFNCNPDSPRHWFYQDWVSQAKEKGVKRLRFLMKDNPIITEEEIQNAEAMFTGVFYNRYILGEWCVADGLVYSLFSDKNTINFSAKIKGMNTQEYGRFCSDAQFYLSIDYGITNPFAAYIWCIYDNCAYCLREYYYDSSDTGVSLTDEEHYENIEAFLKEAGVYDNLEYIVIDPSATSFKELIRRRDKYIVKNAINDVLNGISFTQSLFKSEKLFIDESCENLLEELGLYSWDSSSCLDTVIKEFDHGCDAMRYFCYTVARKELY